MLVSFMATTAVSQSEADGWTTGKQDKYCDQLNPHNQEFVLCTPAHINVQIAT